MCGIFGYLGYREAQPLVIEGLSRLAYRGYDSAGIAIIAEATPLHCIELASSAGARDAGAGRRAVDALVAVVALAPAAHWNP